MGPMVARLVISHCLANQMPASRLCELLRPVKQEENDDYDVDSVNLCTLLETMKKKFDPRRPSLKKYNDISV